jgi:MFS family permease
MAERSLVHTLLHLKGNPRACVYTEPLWGIPFNLYIPFFTVYQYALGVHDRQIGLLLSISLACQMLFSFFAGILTDRIGRRMTTFVFDLVAWTMATAVWALAQDFWWFLLAALLNSLFYIPAVSWNCMLVEDSRPDEILAVYTWITIAGLLAVFFAPLSGLLVNALGVVPAMRILLALTSLLMTSKFVLLYRFSTETEQGRLSQAAARRQPLREALREFGPLARRMLRSKPIALALSVSVILQITGTITGSFFSLYATQNLGIPAQWLAWFPIVRAVVMLVFLLVVQQKLSFRSYRRPLAIGLVIYAAGQLCLILAQRTPWLLAIYIPADALALAMVMPQKDTLVAQTLDVRDRARMMSLLYVAVIGATAPFGWIAGQLSAANRILPFILNIVLYGVCVTLILLGPRQAPANQDAADADLV